MDGCASYWEREGLRSTGFVTRREMRMGQRGHVKFEMLGNHLSGTIGNTDLELRTRNTNSHQYFKLWNQVSHSEKAGSGLS